jgi:hypothetical protein
MNDLLKIWLIIIFIIIIIYLFSTNDTWLYAKKPTGDAPKKSKDNTPKKSKGDAPKKSKGDAPKKGREDIQKIPTQKQVQSGLSTLNKYNTSGKLQPTSSYYDLYQTGYIKFDPSSKKWVTGKDIQIPSAPTSVTGGGSYIKSIYDKSILSAGFVNNAYANDGRRISDKTVASQKGYVINDPGNIVGMSRGCTKSGCLSSILTPADAAKVKDINDKIASNGGMSIGYMSLTIEPKREDLTESKLRKGSDYTSKYMTGWDEYAPKADSTGKPTKAYIDFMKTRIDRMAKAGYKAIELDNIDIVDDKKVSSQSKLNPDKWKQTVSQLIDYAHTKGVGIVQKNTPGGWTDMTSKFSGMIVEVTPRMGQYTYDWKQVREMMAEGKPVILNSSQAGCDSAKQQVSKLVGGGVDTSLLISNCN